MVQSIHDAPKVPVEPATGGRDNAGKPKISMVMEATAAIEGIARVLEFGEKKYSRSDWFMLV